MELSKAIGNRLKNARLQKGYTQEKVAEYMKILQPAYARYESGVIQLNYEQVKTLCEFLEITPNFLWGYED